jgi:hypothetical protein
LRRPHALMRLFPFAARAALLRHKLFKQKMRRLRSPFVGFRTEVATQGVREICQAPGSIVASWPARSSLNASAANLCQRHLAAGARLAILARRVGIDPQKMMCTGVALALHRKHRPCIATVQSSVAVHLVGRPQPPPNGMGVHCHAWFAAGIIADAVDRHTAPRTIGKRDPASDQVAEQPISAQRICCRRCIDPRGIHDQRLAAFALRLDQCRGEARRCRGTETAT